VSKPFDATLNVMLDEEPAAWGRFLAAETRIPLGRVTTLDSDLSSTLQADRLFLVEGPIPAVVHLELESSNHLEIPERLLRYTVIARGVHELPVHSVIMLLRPRANPSDLTGSCQALGADGAPYLTFRYTVIRLWEKSVEDLLSADPALAPLALLTNEAASDLPAAFGRVRERLQADDVPDSVESKVLGAMLILCGLRYTPEQVEQLYEELSMLMQESSTYQLILQRGITAGNAPGQVNEAQSIIHRLGTRRFGEPAAATAAVVQAITDHARLERIIDRVLEATSWDDLLATP
jgi:predicted transposase YdaD